MGTFITYVRFVQGLQYAMLPVRSVPRSACFGGSRAATPPARPALGSATAVGWAARRCLSAMSELVEVIGDDSSPV